ncbi:bacterioferritin [Thermoflexales bacterium]|nr:bacterioferritin [Thermoflexales bacterium]
MKGNDQVIAVLNQLLADELTDISQYRVHSEMCANWGYEKLHKASEHQAADELAAIQAYNTAIRLAQEADDQAAAHLLRKILLMEEDHVEWAEQQSTQIEQMGLANYLANQAAS